MLHAAVATSGVAHGRLLGLELAPARAVPGVVAVLAAADVPGSNSIGVIFGDQPLLIAERVRMVGDRLAIVAAETVEAAWTAARAVGAHIVPLPGVHDP
jgi:xanthine dehydrogenase large subunit